MFFTNNRYVNNSAIGDNFRGNTGISKTLMNDSKKFWQAFTVPIMMNIAKAFCLAAAKYSPPGRHGKQLGTTSIEPRYYYCSIIDLSKYANDKNSQKNMIPSDWPHYKRGEKFKVISNKWRQKKKVLGYAKTMVGAKKLARIKNRGLMKYSWGTLLSNFRGVPTTVSSDYTANVNNINKTGFDIEVPATFRLLAQKSPNITRYNWGSITMQSENVQKSKWKMEGHNNKTDSNAFNSIAVREGTYAAVKTWKATIAALRNSNPNTLQRFLNFGIQKMNRKYNK